MRIAFIGNIPVFSTGILGHLAAQSDFEVVAIVSPPRRSSASTADRFVETVRRAIAYLGPFLPESFYSRFCQNRNRLQIGLKRVRRQTGAHFLRRSANDPSVASLIRNVHAEVVVVAGLNEILKGQLLSMLPWTVNVHPSLLPEFRGPNPFFWILSHGEATSGVTIHFIDEGIDTGDVIAQTTFDIEPWLMCGELITRSIIVGAHLLVDVLRAWKGGPPARHPQQGTGSYFGLPSLKDKIVTFDEDARTVFDRARAAAPHSGLSLWVPADFWRSQVAGSTRAVLAPAEGYLMLELFDAMPLCDIELGEAGLLRRTESGTVAIACQSGTVVFRYARLRRS